MKNKSPIELSSSCTPTPHLEEFQGRNDPRDAGSMIDTDYTPDDHFGQESESDLFH